jgi:hypothetical protein
MTRKIGLFFLQAFPVFGSIFCLVGGLGNQNQTDEVSSDQPNSDIELMNGQRWMASTIDQAE